MNRRPFLAGLAALVPSRASAKTPKFAQLSGSLAEIVEAHRRNMQDLRKQMVDTGMIYATSTSLEFAQAALDRRILSSVERSDAEALGVLIGDEIVIPGDFQWLVVTDSYGVEPVVCHAWKEAYIAPISGVLKRFARGEIDFDVAAFAVGLESTCRAQLADARDLPANLQRRR